MRTLFVSLFLVSIALVLSLHSATAQINECGIASCNSDAVCANCTLLYWPTCCSSQCTDLLNDPFNCGACGTTCPQQACFNGYCGDIDDAPTPSRSPSRSPSPDPTAAVSPAPTPTPVPIPPCDENTLDVDPFHCGSCDIQCGRDSPTCCQGICLDLESDLDNCGACGNSCFDNFGANYTCCNGQCLDLGNTTDPAHACGCNDDCVNNNGGDDQSGAYVNHSFWAQHALAFFEIKK